MYYPCSENKGADQLRGYREADLRLCFRIGNNPVFSRCGSFESSKISNSNAFAGKHRPILWVQKICLYVDISLHFPPNDDLADDDVMILDNGVNVFLWPGKKTSDI